MKSKTGMGSHQSAKMLNDEWLTDPAIISSLGKFDLDPCSPVQRPWNTASVHYNKNDNGLKKDWFGRVWCNPPYGTQTQVWMNKLVTHGNGIALIFARTETKMFFESIWPEADSIFFFSGRLYFYTVEGQKSIHNSGAPSCLVAYGENNSEAIAESGLSGKHIPLKSNHVIVVGISPTWFSVVSMACRQVGDKEMQPIYEMVERIAPDKVNQNIHWKEKIRQQVQAFRKKRETVTISI